MALPYVFANTTGSNPLSHLDKDFAYCLQNPLKPVVLTGAANAYIATPDPAWASYVDGMQILVSFNQANTSQSVTLNVSGLGSVNVLNFDGNGPLVGQLARGYPLTTAPYYLLQYSVDVAGFVILKTFSGFSTLSQTRTNSAVSTLLVENNYDQCLMLEVVGGSYAGTKIQFTGGGWSDGTYRYFGETPVAYGAGTVTVVIGRITISTDTVEVGTITRTIATGAATAFLAGSFNANTLT
jgi:hypothetical protein